MKIYFIALGIIIMSASLQITNDMGIFAAPLPTQSFDSAEGKVTVMTNTTTATDLSNEFSGTMGLFKAIGYIINAIGAAIVIVPLLSSYNVPLAVSIPIQAVIYFVYSIGVFQIITGRGLKYYD
jgi:hypothetical protein